MAPSPKRRFSSPFSIFRNLRPKSSRSHQKTESCPDRLPSISVTPPSLRPPTSEERTGLPTTSDRDDLFTPFLPLAVRYERANRTPLEPEIPEEADEVSAAGPDLDETSSQPPSYEESVADAHSTKLTATASGSPERVRVHSQSQGNLPLRRVSGRSPSPPSLSSGASVSSVTTPEDPHLVPSESADGPHRKPDDWTLSLPTLSPSNSSNRRQFQYTLPSPPSASPTSPTIARKSQSTVDLPSTSNRSSAARTPMQQSLERRPSRPRRAPSAFPLITSIARARDSMASIDSVISSVTNYNTHPRSYSPLHSNQSFSDFSTHQRSSSSVVSEHRLTLDSERRLPIPVHASKRTDVDTSSSG